MKRKIELAAALILSATFLTVAGCGGSKAERLPKEEGRDALKNASVLSMKGDLDLSLIHI